MRRAVSLAFAGAVLATVLSGSGRAGPDGAAAAQARARAALAHGDGIAAQAELEKAEAAGASHLAVAAPMGEALIIQHDYAAAREWLAPGQFGKGDEAYGWRMLGMLERFSGNLAAAGKAYDRALGYVPKDPRIWVDIGRLRYSNGDHLEAIEAADHALQADPDNLRALEFRAQLLRDQAGWEAALPLYERALLKAPDDLPVLTGYAATLGEVGRARDMLTVTRHILEFDANNPQAWFLQAVLAARAGNVNLARRLLVKAGPDLDGVPAAILVKGAMELEAGNANAALAQFERLTQMQPANPRVQLLLARALYESGNTDGLIARFSGSATRPDASPYLLALLARAFEDKGDRLAAAQLLDRVAEAHALPVMPIAEHGGVDAAATIRVQIAAGNINGAAASAQRYVDDHPGSFEAQSLAGDAALAQGVALPALQHYALAARVRFSDRIVLRSVEALERSGQGRAAPAFVVGYFNAFPGSRAAARLAAGHAAYAGDWSHARSLLESLRERGGNRDARLLVDLSLAQLRTGDADAAEETAQRAVDLSPASGVAAQAWGMALVELDRDPDRARQLLTKARRIDGDNPLLAQAFAKLGK